MHGLIFNTSIWLLAGSTRYLSFFFLLFFQIRKKEINWLSFILTFVNQSINHSQLLKSQIITFSFHFSFNHFFVQLSLIQIMINRKIWSKSFIHQQFAIRFIHHHPPSTHNTTTTIPPFHFNHQHPINQFSHPSIHNHSITCSQTASHSITTHLSTFPTRFLFFIKSLNHSFITIYHLINLFFYIVYNFYFSSWFSTTNKNLCHTTTLCHKVPCFFVVCCPNWQCVLMCC